MLGITPPSISRLTHGYLPCSVFQVLSGFDCSILSASSRLPHRFNCKAALFYMRIFAHFPHFLVVRSSFIFFCSPFVRGRNHPGFCSGFVRVLFALRCNKGAKKKVRFTYFLRLRCGFKVYPLRFMFVGDIHPYGLLTFSTMNRCAMAIQE